MDTKLAAVNLTILTQCTYFITTALKIDNFVFWDGSFSMFFPDCIFHFENLRCFLQNVFQKLLVSLNKVVCVLQTNPLSVANTNVLSS